MVTSGSSAGSKRHPHAGRSPASRPGAEAAGDAAARPERDRPLPRGRAGAAKADQAGVGVISWIDTGAAATKLDYPLFVVL